MTEGRARWIVLGIAALAVCVRAPGIFDFWLNADEGIYYTIAHAPAAMARAEIAHNAHPPLYYQLLRGIAYWTPEFSWLRLPALLATGLSILALYALGREAGGIAGGLAAAVAAALAPGIGLQAQVVRPYALQLLAVTFALLGLLRFWRAGRPRDLALYAGAMGVALLLQYGTLVLLLAIGSVLLALARRPRARALLLAHLPLALVAAGLFAGHIRTQLIGTPIRREALRMSLRPYFGHSALDLWQGILGVFGYLAGERFAGVAVVLFAAGLFACAFRGRRLLGALAVAALVSAALFSLARLYPLGATRHSLYLTPLLLATAAGGVGRALALGRRRALVAALAVLGLFAAAAPVNRLLGVSAAPVPVRELDLRGGEVAELRGPLEALAQSPGLVVMDSATAFRLAPLLVAGRVAARAVGSPRILIFPWQARQVAVPAAWVLGVGRTSQVSNLLARLEAEAPEAAAAMHRDLRLVLYHEPEQPRAIASLGRLGAHRLGPVFDEAIETEHFSIFRLDPARYREVFRSRRPAPVSPREPAGAPRGAAG